MTGQPNNGAAWRRFTPEEIREIRASRELRPLARRLGVAPQTIDAIRKRRTYAHVKDAR